MKVVSGVSGGLNRLCVGEIEDDLFFYAKINRSAYLYRSLSRRGRPNIYFWNDCLLFFFTELLKKLWGFNK